MKLVIIVAITIFGLIGGWLGAALDHGNWFGGWSILLSTVGSFFGVWVGFKAGQSLGV